LSVLTQPEYLAAATLPAMSEQNVDLIRKGYEAWNRGDVEGVLNRLEADVDWQGYTHVPEAGTIRGRDEVRAALERFLDAWEHLDIGLVDIFEANDDRVVALVRFRGIGKGSGVEVNGGVDAHVWSIREGKVAGVKMYQGTREALEAAGLPKQRA
jgi:uncharacterized protein